MNQAGVSEIPPHLDNVLKNAKGTEEKKVLKETVQKNTNGF